MATNAFSVITLPNGCLLHGSLFKNIGVDVKILVAIFSEFAIDIAVARGGLAIRADGRQYKPTGPSLLCTGPRPSSHQPYKINITHKRNFLQELYLFNHTD